MLNEQGQQVDQSRDILGEIAKENPRPILIAEQEGKAIAFAGPLDKEPSGRGYFAGIGCHAEYNGLGVAKVLFSNLCLGLKSVDADFMTLFTGEQNKARNIYEDAGFKIIRSWSVMRKEIRL